MELGRLNKVLKNLRKFLRGLATLIVSAPIRRGWKVARRNDCPSEETIEDPRLRWDGELEWGSGGAGLADVVSRFLAGLAGRFTD